MLRQLLQEEGRTHQDLSSLIAVSGQGISEIQLPLRSGDRYVEEAALLLQLLGILLRFRMRKLSIHQADEENGTPLQPLCLVDGGKDQILIRRLPSLNGLSFKRLA
jgi:hypothetical protein